MDKEFKRVFNKRVSNKLPLILETIAPFQDQLKVMMHNGVSA
jgi:hypothetical protein